MLDAFDQASSPVVMKTSDAIVFSKNLHELAEWIYQTVQSEAFHKFTAKLTEWTTYMNKYQSLRDEIATRYLYKESDLTESEETAVEFFLAYSQQPYQRITKLPLFGAEFKKLMDAAYPEDLMLRSKMSQSNMTLKSKGDETNRIKGEKDCYLTLINDVTLLGDEIAALTKTRKFKTSYNPIIRGLFAVQVNQHFVNTFQQFQNFCKFAAAKIEREMPLKDVNPVECNNVRNAVCRSLVTNFAECMEQLRNVRLTNDTSILEWKRNDVMYNNVAPILNKFFAKSDCNINIAMVENNLEKSALQMKTF